MAAPDITTLCPSCAAPLAAPYCAACGQRAPRSSDFTLKSFVKQLWEEVSGSDSRLWQTVLGLFRPGVLTNAYLQYRWRQYLPPLRLYLMMSALFFLLAWGAYFEMQAQGMRSAPAELKALFADPGTAERISQWTASFRFLGVLALGVLVALLHWRKRLPIGRHLVFATHYYCADYAIYLLGTPLLYLAPAEAYMRVAQGVTFGGIAWLAWWAVLADRRVYGGGWAGNVLRGLVILGADMMISVLAGQFALVAVFLTRG